MIRFPSEVTIVVDGGASPNPGHGAFGAVFLDGDRELMTMSEYLGNNCSSNEAEFTAVLESLRVAASNGASVIHFRVDSRFVEQTMAGHVLYPLNQRLTSLVGAISDLRNSVEVDFTWVGRDEVQRAHELVQRAKAGRSYLAPRETGTSRLINDIRSVYGDGEYRRGVYTVRGISFSVLPYYSLKPTVRPSVSRASWQSLRRADWLAWRPYGSSPVPLTSKMVGLQDTEDWDDGGLELMLGRPKKLILGEGASRLGYDGSPVMRIEGTLVPARLVKESELGQQQHRRENERRNDHLRGVVV